MTEVQDHWLIVKVSNEELGAARRALHDVGVSDVVFRSDQEKSVYGVPVEEDRDSVAEIFNRHMDSIRKGSDS